MADKYRLLAIGFLAVGVSGLLSKTNTPVQLQTRHNTGAL